MSLFRFEEKRHKSGVENGLMIDAPSKSLMPCKVYCELDNLAMIDRLDGDLICEGLRLCRSLLLDLLVEIISEWYHQRHLQ